MSYYIHLIHELCFIHTKKGHCIRITLIELIYPYMNIPTLTIIHNETVVSSPLKSHKTIINRTTY